MRNLRRLAWAAVAALAAAAPAAAQPGGGTPTATGGNLGNFQTVPTTTTSTLNTGGNTGTTGTGTDTGTGTTTQQVELTPVEQSPSLRAPSVYGKTPSTIQSSNFLGPTFANPYYSGLLANTRSAAFNPGGFGDPTFGKATGAAARTGGSGAAFSTDPGGQIVQLPRQIAYTAQLKFTPPPVSAPRLQADLRGLIDRAGLTVPAGSVQVQVDGTAVVLRGTVRDDDESRLVEGMIRLTPGVGRITNELSFPR